MYLPLNKGDHIITGEEDEEGLVHLVKDRDGNLKNAATGEVMAYAYYTACIPHYKRSLAGWDYDIDHPEKTEAPVTCLACLAAK